MSHQKKTGKGAVPTSLRISAVCEKLWSILAEKNGLTKTGYLEFTIRRLAREDGINIESLDLEKPTADVVNQDES